MVASRATEVDKKTMDKDEGEMMIAIDIGVDAEVEELDVAVAVATTITVILLHRCPHRDHRDGGNIGRLY